MTVTETRAPDIRFMYRLLSCLFVVVGALLLSDLTVGRWLASSSIVTDVIDIQSPSALLAKVRNAADLPEGKVILLGDSLVAGQVMREHGDQSWRDHTLSAVLQDRFESTGRDRTHVINLGMNGLLPADIETLVDALLPMKPEALVIDISLRSFSSDFAQAESMHSRAWLKPGLQFDANGRLLSLPSESRIDTAIDPVLINNWATYRIRDLLRIKLFSGEPDLQVRKLRDWIEGNIKDSSEGPMAEMRLLLQVRSRYASANLEPSNPQVAAFARMVQKLAAAKQRAIIFYATENPRLLSSLIEPPQYAEFQQKLRQLVEMNGGPLVTYMEPNQLLDDSVFLDHVHVDAQGNQIYGDALFTALSGGAMHGQ